VLFTDGKTFSFQAGKVASSRPYVHPLMLLGFDIYKLPAAEVTAQLAGLKFDLAKFHSDVWQVDERSSWEPTPAICGRPSSGSTGTLCTSFD